MFEFAEGSFAATALEEALAAANALSGGPSIFDHKGELMCYPVIEVSPTIEVAKKKIVEEIAIFFSRMAMHLSSFNEEEIVLAMSGVTEKDIVISLSENPVFHEAMDKAGLPIDFVYQLKSLLGKNREDSEKAVGDAAND